MDGLHWQLSVLSKAIHYKNLSGAASHVGLSQPQLSRIISRLENELGLVLLDRAARRKSGWTPVAYKIAETYARSSRKLTQALLQLKTDDQLTQITIGTLEGLVPLASEFCQNLFAQPKLQVIELNVYDLSELEERFAREELDVVFTCREPGKHKYRHVKNLGFQVVEKISRGGGIKVFSQFEYVQHTHAPQSRRSTKDAREGQILMSNSLAVRKLWIEEHNGSGSIPGEVRRRKNTDGDSPVFLIASDMLNQAVWEKFSTFDL